jgi:hypothetical protein
VLGPPPDRGSGLLSAIKLVKRGGPRLATHLHDANTRRRLARLDASTRLVMPSCFYYFIDEALAIRRAQTGYVIPAGRGE